MLVPTQDTRPAPCSLPLQTEAHGVFGILERRSQVLLESTTRIDMKTGKERGKLNSGFSLQNRPNEGALEKSIVTLAV